MAVVALLVTTVVVAGSVLGVGPFAATPARAVTDPAGIAAGSVQALLDASTFHVEVELDGAIPAAVAGIDHPLDLSGATIVADIDLAAVRSRSVARLPATDADTLELLTVWDDAWFRSGDDPWIAASVAGSVGGSGVDLNPLTLVDRLETYLAENPAVRVRRTPDLPCVAGICRVVTIDAGPEPLALAALFLPDERATHMPDGDVELTIQSDRDTLRPVVVFVTVRDRRGATLLEAAIRFSAWNVPVDVLAPTPLPEGGG